MNKIWNFCRELWQRIDWKPDAVTLLEILLILLVYPLMKWGNPVYFVEDGWVENLQLLILLGGAILALRAKQNKKLFVFVAFALLFMIMRETNLFRGYFCMAYLSPDDLCRWEAFQYGYLAKGARLVFVAYVLYYFVRHKLWQPMIEYVLKAPVFVWDFLILFLMAVGGTVAEFSCIDSEIMEECCETILYLALVKCVYRYSKISL